MLRTFHLHGPLGTTEKSVQIRCETVAEGIELLSTQLPEFRGEPRRIAVVGFDTPQSLFSPSAEDQIDLVPQLTFGKDAGAVQILIGAALIAVAFAIPGGQAAAAWQIKLAAGLMGAGAGLVISGALSYLFPTPSISDSKVESSQYLGPARNTVAIGTPEPILYGFRDIGGHILSMQIDAKETR